MKLILAAASAALVSPALAADYSVNGVFAQDSNPPAATADQQDKLRLSCALHFFINNKNGTFAQYFLDRQKFTGTGEVSYLEANAGSCQMDDKTRLESCQSKFAIDGKIEDEAPSFNFYAKMTPDGLTAHAFASADEFTKWQADGGKNDDGLWSQVKCKDLTSEILAGHLSQQINPLSQDETSKRLFFSGDPTPDDYALARKVMDTMKK